MILIVDDRPENILSLRSILELHSFKVDTASSGEEALVKTLKTAYSLIILDVQMPLMDGFEVAEFLSGNTRTRDIPIIFLSAVNTDKKFITKGYSSGAIDYIDHIRAPLVGLLRYSGEFFRRDGIRFHGIKASEHAEFFRLFDEWTSAFAFGDIRTDTDEVHAIIGG